jgi:hypothetical protein
MLDEQKQRLYVEKHFAEDVAYRFEKDVYIRIGASEIRPLIPEMVAFFDDSRICRYTYIEGTTVLEYLEQCEIQSNQEAATIVLHQLFEWLVAFYRACDAVTNKSGGSMSLTDLNLRNFVYASDGRVFGIDFEEMSQENRMLSMIRLIAMYRQCAPIDSFFKRAVVEAFLTKSTREKLAEIGKMDLTVKLFNEIYNAEVARIQHRRENR